MTGEQVVGFVEERFSKPISEKLAKASSISEMQSVDDLNLALGSLVRLLVSQEAVLKTWDEGRLTEISKVANTSVEEKMKTLGIERDCIKSVLRSVAAKETKPSAKVSSSESKITDPQRHSRLKKALSAVSTAAGTAYVVLNMFGYYEFFGLFGEVAAGVAAISSASYLSYLMEDPHIKSLERTQAVTELVKPETVTTTNDAEAEKMKAVVVNETKLPVEVEGLGPKNVSTEGRAYLKIAGATFLTITSATYAVASWFGYLVPEGLEGTGVTAEAVFVSLCGIGILLSGIDDLDALNFKWGYQLGLVDVECPVKVHKEIKNWSQRVKGIAKGIRSQSYARNFVISSRDFPNLSASETSYFTEATQKALDEKGFSELTSEIKKSDALTGVVPLAYFQAHIMPNTNEFRSKKKHRFLSRSGPRIERIGETAPFPLYPSEVLPYACVTCNGDGHVSTGWKRIPAGYEYHTYTRHVHGPEGGSEVTNTIKGPWHDASYESTGYAVCKACHGLGHHHLPFPEAKDLNAYLSEHNSKVPAINKKIQEINFIITRWNETVVEPWNHGKLPDLSFFESKQPSA